MPASSIPVVALVVAMFGAFMLTLGAVSLRLALADRRDARLARHAARPIRTMPQPQSLSLAA